MGDKKVNQKWQGMREEVNAEIAEWRQQHPRATFREIEAEEELELLPISRSEAPTIVTNCPECSSFNTKGTNQAKEPQGQFLAKIQIRPFSLFN
jgi:hypothetical protein